MLFQNYIPWTPVDNLEDYRYIRPQKVQKINRLGFDVLEWGGAQMSSFPRKKEAL